MPLSIRISLNRHNVIPSVSYLAQKVKLYPKDMLKVSGAKAKVVGGKLTKTIKLK